MRCNKCGEEYKDNQAFCLKCGNPIHVVPDFNLIEAGLANDVGLLMNDEDDKKNASVRFDSATNMKTVNVPVDDISMELKMVDINRGRFNFDDDDFALIDEEAQNRQRSNDNRPARNQQARPTTANKKNVKKPSNRKANIKNVLIMLGCVVAVAVAIAVIWKVVFSSNLNDSNNFQEQYNIAKTHYEAGEKKDAIAEAKKAVKVAYSQSEVLKARKLLNDVYVYFEVSDEEYIENLLKIVEIDDSSVKHNEAILDYYYTNQMYTEFNDYFLILEGKITTENMTKYLPATPTVDLEGGHYDTFLSITLTGPEGTTIYYTLDGNEPKNNDSAFEYTEPIQLSSEGTTTIKAYAKDANGIMSATLESVYIIEDVEVSGPSVSPSSGAYTDYEMIEVTVPEGSKVYYTTDGTDPTSSSTEYTEPIDMPYGRSDYKFVSIDEAGVASNITSVTYNLTPTRNVTVAEAEGLVEDKFLKELEENEPESETEDETDGESETVEEPEYTFKYKTREVIDNVEYYLIEVAISDASKESVYYAVNTYDKSIVLATRTDDTYTLEEQEE